MGTVFERNFLILIYDCSLMCALTNTELNLFKVHEVDGGYHYVQLSRSSIYK